MELRALAVRILRSESLDEKLARPTEPLTDAAPGPAWRPERPARPPELRFAGRREAPAMPAAGTFADPLKRGLAHHIMANHELQALEVMAWVLVAFPAAPAEFRRGLADVLFDEQRHTRMHVERGAALGVRFGSRPVNAYFWLKAQEFADPLDYLAGLPLTFEARNLDHTLEFEAAFRAAGDERSASTMAVIHRDEIRHVAFGWEWLLRLKPAEQSPWDAYCAHLHWPLRPSKSRGRTFDVAARKAAGLTDDFIAHLSETEVEEG